MNDEHVRSIASRFRVQGTFVSAKRYGSGHINDTYLAWYRTADRERPYIHQRINDRVFPNVPALMENVGRVTRHVKAKLGGAALTLVTTDRGEDVLRDADGSWWRTYEFVEGARSRDTVDRPEQGYQAARAFGRFVRALVDLPGDRLHETIPSFHDTTKRFSALVETAGQDPMGRTAGAAREIDYCRRNESLADALAALQREGISRECVTHNDTKVNNVMLDETTGEGVCVIDLDTVMPGLALYDFGDMVRTATIPVAEDERNLSLVEVNAQMFEALARGFIEGAGPLLRFEEREHLVTAGMVMTFECGVRFLTDYLGGDTYFRISRPEQNLDRARTQFALVASLSRHKDRLQRSIAGLAGHG